MPDSHSQVADILEATAAQIRAISPTAEPAPAPPPPPPPRTAVETLLDHFVESLRPAHDKWAAVPFSEITMTKQGLWEAGQALVIQYDALLKAASPVAPPSATTPAPTTTEAPHA